MVVWGVVDQRTYSLNNKAGTLTYQPVVDAAEISSIGK